MSNFDIVKEPLENRTFTTTELGQVFKCDNWKIVYLKTRLNITPTRGYIRGSQVDLYTYRDYMKFKKYFEEKSEEKRKALLDQIAEETEEEKLNDHPLIKDPRCLKLSWFPDIVPECFKDLEA